MKIGQRLYELRRAKNLSQEEVAEKLDVSRQTISKWETDQSTPDFDKIEPLCKLYGITADELLTGVKSSNKKDENSNNTINLDDAKKHMFTRGRDDDDDDDEFKNPIAKQINGILALITLIIYLFISFESGAWHITWIIWIVYAVICKIVDLIFMLKEGKK